MDKTTNNFDVIVIGGGHAGMEAAYASANLGSKTLLLSIKKDRVGWCPCNPSIGGLGKGHIVYELGALNGLMPKLCSKTHLQVRMLNTSKGPAVQGLRVQIDKYEYSKLALKMLSKTKNLSIFEGEVIELLISKNSKGTKQATGIKTKNGKVFLSPSVIIATGTFLNGQIHLGMKNWKGGREGESHSERLGESLENTLGVKLGRLKTGTPPRLLKKSIDFTKLEKQTSHKLDYLYEFDPVETHEIIPCFITTTNKKTHVIIQNNFHRSALFGGNIAGIGPRYCPSIEDKIARFPQKECHHVFVEPEGEKSDEVYPAGLSTSLPLDVQEEYIRSINGFEKAIISKPGYAIEYDYLQPTHLKYSLESKTVEGLFFAGQINGTTGYEEAAGQGAIAGINAYLKLKGKEPFILNRNESYIGVMIDDLVTIGVDEPYRMFTSRAERRLLLRQDNTLFRIMPHAKKLGLISDEKYNLFLQEKEIFQKSLKLIKDSKKENHLFDLFASIKFTEEIKKKAKTLLIDKLTEENYNNKTELERLISSRVLLGVHAEIKYSGYLQREIKEIEKAQKYQSLKIPVDFSYKKLPGLNLELQEKLTRFKPPSIAQAQLIPGMTPAAISLLIFQVKLANRQPIEIIEKTGKVKYNLKKDLPLKIKR